MTTNQRDLNLVPGKLYKVIEDIGCTNPTYEYIPISTIVMLIEIKTIQQLNYTCKQLVFLVGKKILSANFNEHQFPDYLVKL